MRRPALATSLLCAALLLADPAYAQGVEPSQGATVVVVLGSLTLLLAMAASALTIAGKLAERREKRAGAKATDHVEARLAALERVRDADASGQFVAAQSEETTRARISALERKVARIAANCAVRHPPSEGAPE